MYILTITGKFVVVRNGVSFKFLNNLGITSVVNKGKTNQKQQTVIY
jgi:hypothetical protein